MEDAALRAQCDSDEARKQHGLPARGEGRVFCNFNTIDKLEPEMFGIWMQAPLRSPGSVLWLLRPKKDLGRLVAQNLRAEAAGHGVHPRRIVMAPRIPKFDHLARYRYCDLFLDTFMYGAHSTASDALWGFTPLLTTMGGTFPSRVASDLVTAGGTPELVVHSKSTFSDEAERLSSSPRMLHGLRRRLSKASCSCRSLTRREWREIWSAHIARYGGCAARGKRIA